MGHTHHTLQEVRARVHTQTHTLSLVLLSEDVTVDAHLLQISAAQHHLIQVFSSRHQQLLCLHGWAPLLNDTPQTLKLKARIFYGVHRDVCCF